MLLFYGSMFSAQCSILRLIRDPVTNFSVFSLPDPSRSIVAFDIQSVQSTFKYIALSNGLYYNCLQLYYIVLNSRYQLNQLNLNLCRHMPVRFPCNILPLSTGLLFSLVVWLHTIRSLRSLVREPTF